MLVAARWLGVATLAVAAASCHGARHDGAPTVIGNSGRGDGTAPIDAGVPAAGEPRPADPEAAWLFDVRTQLRALDLGPCRKPAGGVDAACLCRDACALALPEPPSAGTRVVDWSDGLKLYVADDGQVTACAARPTAGAAWVSNACPRGTP